MSDAAAAHGAGLIGPNAILQLLPVLDRFGGPDWRADVLADAGVTAVPDGSAMIPEIEAARLHHHLRDTLPDPAQTLASAGTHTADYILANRIPALAQTMLKALPPYAAARILARAIAKNAWTFAGSGQFHVASPWRFEIEGNPLISGETSPTCLCDWHAAVFARLYQVLVTKTCTCVETRCAAQYGSDRCQFDLSA